MRIFCAAVVAAFLLSGPAPARADDFGSEWNARNEEVYSLFNSGQIEDAIKLARENLKFAEDNANPDDIVVAISLDALGSMLFVRGDPDAAEPVLRRALKILRALPGPDGLVVEGRVVGNLGQLLRGRGDFEAAKPMFERALELNEAELGPDHSLVGLALDNLALLLQDMGDNEGARPLLRRAVAIFEASFGADHPYTLQAKENLAQLGG